MGSALSHWMSVRKVHLVQLFEVEGIGDARGRLNEGLVVRLAAEFNGLVRDLLDETSQLCKDSLGEHPLKTVFAELLNERLKRAVDSPTSKNIEKAFAVLGVAVQLDADGQNDPELKSALGRLSDLQMWRDKLAHGSRVEQGLPGVGTVPDVQRLREYLESIGRIVVRMAAVVDHQLQSLLRREVGSATGDNDEHRTA